MRKLITLIALIATLFVTIGLTSTEASARPRPSRRPTVTRSYRDRRAPARRYVQPRYVPPRYVYPRYQYSPWYWYYPRSGITFYFSF